MTMETMKSEAETQGFEVNRGSFHWTMRLWVRKREKEKQRKETRE